MGGYFTEGAMLLGQIVLYFVFSASNVLLVQADDVVACGGFVQSEVDIDYSRVQVRLAKTCSLLFGHIAPKQDSALTSSLS